jgi:hypothetical protein
MKKDLALRPVDFTSSFLSCEKDLEEILRRLFIESQPYSDELKKLLVINTKDCLDNKTSEVYKNAIKDMSLAKLRDDGYIKFEPKVKMPEHEEIKSYLIFSFDNFTTNQNNPEFRDCNVYIDILCHTDCWDLGNFRIRPLKIAGYIDGILNKARLSGIGTFQFTGCNELVLDETLSGYTLSYSAIHGTDDVLPSSHDWIER